MRLIGHYASGQWIKATNAAEKVMAKGITISMREGSKVAVQKGREVITAAGFSERFARTLVALNKPKTGYVLNPSVWIHSTINYADVFETGKTIVGDPFLWLPFPNVPPFKGRKHMTAKQYVQNVGPLIPMRIPGSLPILGAPVKERVVRAKRRITRRSLIKGAASAVSETLLIPMFFAVRSITIPKKFDATAAVENALEGFQIIVDKNIPDQEIP